MYYCTLYVYKLNLTTGLYVQKKRSIIWDPVLSTVSGIQLGVLNCNRLG